MDSTLDSSTVKENQQRLWGAQADYYERVLDPLFQPIVEGLIERACLWPGESALDVGTGTGSVGLAAASRVGACGEVFGIDLAPEMIAVAQRRAQSLGLTNFQAQPGDAEAVPFSDATFDVVLSGLTYMLCPEPNRAFREAHRVIAPNGRLVMAVWGRPERCAFRLVLQVMAGYLPAGPSGPSPFGLADVDRLWEGLRDTGFRPAVEALDLSFDYPDRQAFVDAHAFALREILPPEDYQRASEEIADRMGRPAGPLRLTNEVVFAIGYR